MRSKAGLHGLTRAVAVDHGAEGIRCNAVAPGWIDTDLNIDFIESMPDPAGFRHSIGNIHPVGRTGKPEEVANLVAWLASSESSFVTGQVWSVDGGRMAKLSLPQQGGPDKSIAYSNGRRAARSRDYCTESAFAFLKAASRPASTTLAKPARRIARMPAAVVPL